MALYDENLHDRYTFQSRRAIELADTIKNGSMNHWFQPTMSIETGQIIGMETLVRWTHPVDGVIAQRFPADGQRTGTFGDIGFVVNDRCPNSEKTSISEDSVTFVLRSTRPPNC